MRLPSCGLTLAHIATIRSVARAYERQALTILKMRQSATHPNRLMSVPTDSQESYLRQLKRSFDVLALEFADGVPAWVGVPDPDEIVAPTRWGPILFEVRIGVVDTAPYHYWSTFKAEYQP